VQLYSHGLSVGSLLQTVSVAQRDIAVNMSLLLIEAHLKRKNLLAILAQVDLPKTSARIILEP
jgi:hypothetical protein